MLSKLKESFSTFSEAESVALKILNSTTDDEIKYLRRFTFKKFNNKEFLAERKVQGMSTHKDLLVDGSKLFVILKLTIENKNIDYQVELDEAFWAEFQAWLAPQE